MSRFLTIVLIAVGVATSLYGQQNYNAAGIPSELLKNADAVVRNMETVITINAIDNAQVLNKYAITILNKDGLKHSGLKEFYNKLVTLGKIKGSLYDASGDEIKKMKSSELIDRAMYGYSFFDDSRYKEHDFHYSIFPFTVAYETESTCSTLYILNDWEPQDDDNISVENATIKIIAPKNIPLQFKTFNTTKQVVTQEDDDKYVTQFQLKNIPAVEEDDYEEFNLFSYPAVAITPDTLALGPVYGSMKSWKSFGKFYSDLNKDRDILPDNMKVIVHQLTDTCSSPFSKISVLYEYLKNNTRYVSIQLGIGGWQTLQAKFVAEKGYGDCKALTNYMKAMLREAGIKSYEAIVLAGRNKNISLPGNFVHNHFNHVILCIPAKTDTTWLECTAKTLPAGYLSSFTADRDVLIATPRGGHIAHTPIYTQKHNQVTRNAILYLTTSGEIEGSITTTYSGNEFDEEYRYYHSEPSEKIEKHLNNQFSITSYRIKNFSTSVSANGFIPQLIVKTDVTGSGNIKRSGNRIFINPVITQVTNENLPIQKERIKPFHINNSYTVSDTTTFILTGNTFTMEHLPENFQYTFPFGEFSGGLSFENGNKVIYVRHFKLTQGTYPPAIYNDYIKFIKQATNDAERMQVVLLKKD